MKLRVEYVMQTGRMRFEAPSPSAALDRAELLAEIGATEVSFFLESGQRISLQEIKLLAQAKAPHR